MTIDLSLRVFLHRARSYLPLRIGGFYDEEELSMSSDRDFPGLSKVSKLPYAFTRYRLLDGKPVFWGKLLGNSTGRGLGL